MLLMINLIITNAILVFLLGINNKNERIVWVFWGKSNRNVLFVLHMHNCDGSSIMERITTRKNEHIDNTCELICSSYFYVSGTMQFITFKWTVDLQWDSSIYIEGNNDQKRIHSFTFSRKDTNSSHFRIKQRALITYSALILDNLYEIGRMSVYFLYVPNKSPYFFQIVVLFDLRTVYKLTIRCRISTQPLTVIILQINLLSSLHNLCLFFVVQYIVISYYQRMPLIRWCDFFIFWIKNNWMNCK